MMKLVEDQGDFPSFCVRTYTRLVGRARSMVECYRKSSVGMFDTPRKILAKHPKEHSASPGFCKSWLIVAV